MIISQVSYRTNGPLVLYITVIRTSPSPQSGGKENTVGLAVGLMLALVLLWFILYITVIRTSPSPQSGGKENTVGLAVGLVLALILLVAVTVIALFLYRYSVDSLGLCRYIPKIDLGKEF